MSTQPAMLSVDELAEQWNVSPQWIYGEVRQGRLPCIRLGGMIRFAPDGIDRYVEQHSTEAVA